MATPSIVVIWALWPQQWAAPVSGLANSWSATSTESSSPMTAMFGPGRRRPETVVFRPVIAICFVVSQSQPAELAADDLGRLELLEAQFRIAIDRIADILDQVIGVAVDLFEDALFQIFKGHGSFLHLK